MGNTKESTMYYTPSITDLFVGYKCEYESNGKWEEIIVTGIDEEERIIKSADFSYHFDPRCIRTRHLSKDDIINEGWWIHDLVERNTLEKEILTNGKLYAWFNGATFFINKDAFELKKWSICNILSINEFRKLVCWLSD